MARGVGHGTRRGRNRRSASGRHGCQRRSHASGRHRLVAIGRDVDASRRPTLSDRRRWAVAETVEVIVAVVDVDSRSGMAGILIDSVLHLSEEVVNLNKILLGSGVGGHWQVVLLGQRVLSGSRAAVSHAWAGRLREVVLGSSHRAVRNRERAVKGHQRATNLAVGRRVNLAALSTAEEVIDHVEGALAIKTGSSIVAEVLSTLVVDRGLVEVETIVCRRLGSIVVARMVLRLLVVLSTHLAIVVVVARGCEKC